MTLKSDAKFKEIMTCSFKCDMGNFVNFHLTTQKSKHFILMGYFCPKYEVWVKKIQKSYLSRQGTVMKTLNKPWPCGFKNGELPEELGELSLEHLKVWKIMCYWLFLSKANFSVRKFRRNYVSSHWKVMQNLKESWFVTSKKT